MDNVLLEILIFVACMNFEGSLGQKLTARFTIQTSQNPKSTTKNLIKKKIDI